MAAQRQEISLRVLKNISRVSAPVTKVDFQVLCLQVGEGRKISEVQVRVCYCLQRLFSFI